MSGVWIGGNDNWLPAFIMIVVLSVALYLGSFFFLFRSMTMWADIARKSGIVNSIESDNPLSHMIFLFGFFDVATIVKVHRLQFPRSNLRLKCVMSALIGIILFCVAMSLISG